MRKILAACSVILLTGCYSVPQQVDFSLKTNRNYKAVADCAWHEFRTLGNWTKTDLDSQGKSEFAFGNGTSTAGRIDIIATGPNSSEVRSYFPAAVWGKEYWPSRHRPIFAKCG